MSSTGWYLPPDSADAAKVAKLTLQLAAYFDSFFKKAAITL